MKLRSTQIAGARGTGEYCTKSFQLRRSVSVPCKLRKLKGSKEGAGTVEEVRPHFDYIQKTAPLDVEGQAAVGDMKLYKTQYENLVHGDLETPSYHLERYLISPDGQDLYSRFSSRPRHDGFVYLWERSRRIGNT